MIPKETKCAICGDYLWGGGLYSVSEEYAKRVQADHAKTHGHLPRLRAE